MYRVRKNLPCHALFLRFSGLVTVCRVTKHVGAGEKYARAEKEEGTGGKKKVARDIRKGGISN